MEGLISLSLGLITKLLPMIPALSTPLVRNIIAALADTT
jgi:hypothetical protein